MPVYASDPNAARDSEFEPGELRHLVSGNAGRLLDARRTPVTVTEVVLERAAFEVEIAAFEDTGARWELSLDEVARFQFARGAASAPPPVVHSLEEARRRAAQTMCVSSTPAARQASLRRLLAQRQSARAWLADQRPPKIELRKLVKQRASNARACSLLDAFMADRGLADMEQRFSETYVSNPASREVIKGHAVVLAELGLCPYRGPVVRDPHLFDGPTSKAHRAEHILARLAFVHELFAAAGTDTVTLYRGAAADGPRLSRRPVSFVSATFSSQVAAEHFEGGLSTRTAVLWRQEVLLDRLFMTFVETRALGGRFREAEAVLLADPENHAF